MDGWKDGRRHVLLADQSHMELRCSIIDLQGLALSWLIDLHEVSTDLGDRVHRKKESTSPHLTMPIVYFNVLDFLSVLPVYLSS